MRFVFILFIAIIGFLAHIVAQSCGSFLDNSTLLAFDRNTFTIEYSPKSPTVASYFDFQGLRISLASNGEMLVSETPAGRIVWRDGFTNQVCNATLNCRLIFQSNGNLVIYYDSKPTGEPWSTYTNNMNAAALLFRTSPPYIQIVNSSCGVLKYATKLGEARSTPIQGPTKNITVSGPAIKANVWRKTLGVNTHCSQGWSSALVYNLTVYMGAGQVRDGLPTAAQTADFVRMKNAGVTLVVLVKGAQHPNISALNATLQKIAAFHTANPGVITAMEGFNEIDNFGFTYNGITNFENDFSGMFQAQKDLYTLVKNNPVLKNLPVYDFSGGCSANGQSLGCSNYTGRGDLGNGHNYPVNGAQPVRNYNYKNDLYSSINGYKGWTSASNFVITEFGYHSSNYTPAGLGEGVTLEAQSILLVNYYLAAVKFKFAAVYSYELINEEWAGYQGAQSHFGLFYKNGTTKPVARSIHFISELLADAGGKTNSLTYTLSNLPPSADYLLFQKTNSRFVLIVWNKAPVYNYLTDQDIPRPAVQVGLSLPLVTANTTFKVYDVNGVGSDYGPINPVSNVVVSGKIGTSFNFTNRPVVITIN